MYKNVIKRILDFLLALIGLILSSPFQLIACLLILIIDKMNPFFKQERVGKKEKVFYILMNLQFEDEVYEMFISMFECKIKIKGLLLKIKDYKTKCKYFDMLPN